jgi:hypothetical protein
LALCKRLAVTVPYRTLARWFLALWHLGTLQAPRCDGYLP